jgi:organic radical activating enzyme
VVTIETVETGFLSEAFVSWQGEGAHAGARHLFVRTAGCNIRCGYCDTPDSLEPTRSFRADYPDGCGETLSNPVDVETLARVVDHFLRLDPGVSMIAITGGEPMVQSGFLTTWLARRPPPVRRMLETNALIVAGLDEVLAHVDVVSADLKLPTPTRDGSYWKAHERFLERCAHAVRERGSGALEVYVKIPVDAVTPPSELEQALALVEAVLPAATVFVQPVTDPDSGRWQLEPARLLELAAAGYVAGHGSRLRIRPQLHKLAGVR